MAKHLSSVLKRIGFGLLGAGVLMTAGCATSPPALPPDPSVLRVGICPNLPPLAYRADGEIVGMEADFAVALAAALGRQARLVPMDWDELIPALTANNIDIIMSGMSITKMRTTLAAFTTPYLEVGQMALVRRPDYLRLGNPLILTNTPLKVGLEKGTTGDLFAQAKMPKAERVYYRSPEDAAKALLQQRVEVLIYDAPTVWWLAARHEADGLRGVFTPLTEEYLAWAVSRGNPELLDAVNETLAAWRDGTLSRLMDRWIP